MSKARIKALPTTIKESISSDVGLSKDIIGN